MYQKKVDISLHDALKKFPKWSKAWKHGNDENYQRKYKYLYMGFGNGLSIDNSIYEEYKTYLEEAVKKYLENHPGEMEYVAIYSTWEIAFINIVKDQKYILK